MKHPKPRHNVSEKVKPTEEKYNPEKNPPRFSFRYVIEQAPFDYDSLEKEDKVHLVDRLYKLSQLTWAEIRLSSRHKLGCEKIEEGLKSKISNCAPADANILAFRFSGMAAMLGYRSAFGTFYIIAFDTKFKAYDHG